MTSTADTRPRWLVLAALVMVAINLRMALSSIPAVLKDIQDATGWSGLTLGTLTTIPVLCMGVFALAVPRIARRIGRRQAVALALLFLVVALTARLFAEVPGVLHLSVLLAGVGIAIAGGLVPSIVREQLPDAVGAATGLWTATMLLGAAMGGSLTVPLADWFGSWQKALAFWAIPAALGLLVWWRVEAAHHPAQHVDRPLVGVRELPWRNRTAWALTIYLAMNSVVFYTSLAWLAPSFVERGWSRTGAGWLLGVFTVSEVGFALVMPHMAERSRARRTIYAMTIGFVVLPILAVAWIPNTWTWAVIFIFGAALGGGFAMGLALLAEYGATPAASARLTAMAFFVTYVTAALGPIIAGAILDAVDSWPTIYTLLAAAAAVQLATVPALGRGIRIE